MRKMLQATVLLVDDNPDFLKLAGHLLQPHFQVVDAVSNGESALRAALTLFPDIILMDISLGDLNGFEIVRRMRMLGSRAKAVFFSVHEDPEFVRAAADIGAFGYIFKSRARADLVRALTQIRAGGKFFPVLAEVQRI